MKKWILPLLAVAAAGGIAAVCVGQTEADGGSASVRVIGLEVVKPLPGDKQKQSLTGRRTGTVLTVQVHRADMHFLGLDASECRLETFSDDRGVELIDDSAKMLRTWVEDRAWVRRDGRRCAFELRAARCPSRGARRLEVRGTVVLKVGQQRQTAEQANFRLAKDGKLTAGPVPMEITGVQVDAKGAIFCLSARKSTDRIAQILFFGPDGKEIESELVEKSIVGFMGNTFHERTYRLTSKRRLRAVTARVVYFKRIKTLSVPLRVAAGVGL